MSDVIDVFAVVQGQFFSAGATLTGIAPNGTDSGITNLRGRYRKWTACTNGGLFSMYEASKVHESPSGQIRHILWNLPGATNVTLEWIDMDGAGCVFINSGAATGYLDIPQSMLILPQGHLKMSATGALSGAGSIITIWDDGMRADPFSGIARMGKSVGLP